MNKIYGQYLLRAQDGGLEREVRQESLELMPSLVDFSRGTKLLNCVEEVKHELNLRYIFLKLK